MVDETDRMLREEYQSWLPTVLEMTHPNSESIMPQVNSFFSFCFWSFKNHKEMVSSMSVVPSIMSNFTLV